MGLLLSVATLAWVRFGGGQAPSQEEPALPARSGATTELDGDPPGFFRALRRAGWALLFPFIILGGIKQVPGVFGIDIRPPDQK